MQVDNLDESREYCLLQGPGELIPEKAALPSEGAAPADPDRANGLGADHAPSPGLAVESVG